MIDHLRRWFAALLRPWVPAPPALPPAPKKQRLRRSLAALLAQAGPAPADAPTAPPLDCFKAVEPPPGVLPSGQKLALDEQITSINGWAFSSSIFHEGVGFLGYPYLAELAQRPEYRRPSEIIAKEMTRKWITITSAGDTDNTEKIAAITKEMTRLKVQRAFRRAAEQDGFFGRSHIYIDLGVKDPAELQTPIGDGSGLGAFKIKKGALKALRVVEPVWTYPNAYNSQDPLAGDYYKPTSWFVQGKLVDASRLLTFVSREVSDLLKPAYSFGGLSLSQMAKPYIDNWLRTRQSVSDLLHSFTVFELATDMEAVLQGGDDGGDGFGSAGDALLERIELFNRFRDNRGTFVINKDTEEFSNVSAPLGGLDALQAQAQEQQAAVLGIPLVKLLGITPSGLNASTEGELRCFYDWIEALQEGDFTDPLTTVLNLVQLSLYEKIDPDIGFRFNPLMQLTDKELAEKRKTDAEIGDILIANGTIDPAEERQRVAADEDSPYASLDLNKEILPPDEAGAEGDDPDGELARTLNGGQQPTNGSGKPLENRQ